MINIIKAKICLFIRRLKARSINKKKVTNEVLCEVIKDLINANRMMIDEQAKKHKQELATVKASVTVSRKKIEDLRKFLHIKSKASK